MVCLRSLIGLHVEAIKPMSCFLAYAKMWHSTDLQGVGMYYLQITCRFVFASVSLSDSFYMYLVSQGVEVCMLLLSDMVF